MLPDGAHLRAEDWTVFYLGQTSHSGLSVSTAILGSDPTDPSSSPGPGLEVSRRASMLAPEDRPPRGVPGGGLLYVLNCVRMKEDKSMRRGAMVKAMAICSPFPYIGIYKVGPYVCWRIATIEKRRQRDKETRRERADDSHYYS